MPAKIYSIISAEQSTAATMSNNGVAISLSDDDPEDPLNRMRPRVRRKRKKPGSRSRPDLTRRIVVKLLKWWPALLLLPAAGLLIYEAIKIGGGEIRSPPPVRKSDNVAAQSSKAKPQGNLNKLDPLTRVVGGVRERKSYFFISVLQQNTMFLFFLLGNIVAYCVP